MLKDDLDDDMDAADDPVSYASVARAGTLDVGQFRPEDIDMDVSGAGPAMAGGAAGMFRPEGIDIDDDVDDVPLAHMGIVTVVPARAFVATTEEAPGPWPLPPSQTRKRTRAKLAAGPAATSSLKPDSQGLWPCSSCSALYASRTGLYGHLRFCTALDAWRCEWCRCGAHHTPHKSSGPSGPKTLCSACSARFRAGHNGPPQKNDAGQYVCDQCDRQFATVAALGGHRRFCDGGAWRCNWCECRAEQTQGKGPGPAGPMTLCAPCSSRFRSGHAGPPARDETGRYLCEECGRSFDSIAGLGTHRARCDGGAWACGWCGCKQHETSGKGPGPQGTKTLCSTCSARFRGGHSGPPCQDEDGRFVCAHCDRTFDTFAARGVHMRRCDGGSWRCGWCEAKIGETSGKGPGPDGPGSLCSTCSSRFRAGHTGPPQQDEEGRYVCECLRTFETIAAMGVHRRHCDGGKWLCSWCGCSHSETSGKGAGPDGPRTLCAACASRYRAGHREPPQRDSSGKFLCGCGRAFESMSGLGSHRRHCSQAPTKAPAAAATEPNAEATGGGDAAEAREAATEPAVHAAGAGDGTEMKRGAAVDLARSEAAPAAAIGAAKGTAGGDA